MLTVAASFTQGGVPADGLTLSEIELHLASVDKATGAVAEVWDGSQHPSGVIAGQGVYFELYADDDLDAEHYFAAAHYVGAEAVDSAWVAGSYSRDATAGADALLMRDAAEIEAVAPKHSMLSAILKATSKVDGATVPGQLITYRTDGETEHMRQAVGTDDELEPVAWVGNAT